VGGGGRDLIEGDEAAIEELAEAGRSGEAELAGEPELPVEAPADPVLDTLERIEDKLSESQRLIDRQAEIAARLHEENQALRGGELRSAQTALVLGVLRVHDDVRQMALASEEPSSERDLAIVADALVDALARNGVDPAHVSPGEPFEASRHKVAEIEITTDPDADRTVARVVRTGFVWSDGTVVRVSDVVVLKHAPPPESDLT
jgi:molecular chaperone GrpE (heat shock protein)